MVRAEHSFEKHVFLVFSDSHIPLGWFQMVARFRETNVGTRGTSAGHAMYGHKTTRVLLHEDYVIEYKKGTQTLKIIWVPAFIRFLPILHLF